MTAPMVDYKIHWLKMMSVPQSRAVVGRHDGINGRDNTNYGNIPSANVTTQNQLRDCIADYQRQGYERVPGP